LSEPNRNEFILHEANDTKLVDSSRLPRLVKKWHIAGIKTKYIDSERASRRDKLVSILDFTIRYSKATYASIPLGPSEIPPYWLPAIRDAARLAKHTVASPVYEQTYATQHAVGCDGCAFPGPDMSMVSELIMHGKIPVITVAVRNGEVSLAVVNAQEAVGGYTVTSHVWSEGLGNVEANTLPLCQLRRITSYCKQVEWTLFMTTEGALKKGVSEESLALEGNAQGRAAHRDD
jgi:hypothetical protein